MTLTVGSIFGGHRQTRQEHSRNQHNRCSKESCLREEPEQGGGIALQHAVEVDTNVIRMAFARANKQRIGKPLVGGR